MILPIIPYGNPLLHTVSKELTNPAQGISRFIKDLFSTMINANGVGISAIQVAEPINLFIINTDAALKKTEDISLKNKKKVFINAKIIRSYGEFTDYKEGCLSIPTIFEYIQRPSSITINYLDDNFKTHTENFSGFIARVIQHEYDHIHGKLFIDYLPKTKREELKPKLKLIAEGKIHGPYPMLH